MHCIDDMSRGVNIQIIFGLQYCKYFTLTLDERYDITGNVLSIFMCYMNNNFDIVHVTHKYVKEF